MTTRKIPGHPPTPSNESSRLAALLRFELLDTPAEAMFDNITALAAQICETPIALISLVDAERQWFKSRQGLDARETPRELAFCAHAINGETLFEVENALLDPRFRDNPLVTGAPDIRFYAGMPLADSEGRNLGTLCVIDRQPRQLSVQQKGALKLLAQQAINLFELRLQTRQQQEQAALHKAILSSVGTAVLITDMAGVIRQASPGVLPLLGYEVDTLVGQSLGLVLPDEERQLQPDPVRPSFNCGSEQASLHELRARHRKGQRIPVLFSLAPIAMDGSAQMGYLCILNDLSYREEALQRLQHIAEQLPGVVYQFQLYSDGRSCFPYASEGLRDVYGLQPEEVREDASSVFARIHPDDLLDVTASIQASAEHLSVWHREYRFLHPIKGLIWLEGRAMPQPRADDSILWHGFITDITQRKHLEQMKNEFVSTVSHELRTPLTSIAGSLGLINGEALGPVPNAMREMLSIAQSNSQRLRQLIDDLLDMDKLLAGKMNFIPQQLDIDSFLAECVTSHQGFARQHDVQLTYTGGPVAQITADPMRLQQVLSNLLSNALKFSPAGSQVLLSAQELGGQIRILVVDQGPGVPAEFVDRLFEKFSQADASDRRQKGGTGLGLAISKELIERMGGCIGFYPRPGGGSVFWVELPALFQDETL
ncbi:ATP-binding protein [Pseudomonas sp. GD03721]|nr:MULTISPECIES: ATP-binding protein [Pseudomonas]MDH1444018.1 ATP-binding protein [Pseudomonas sp. GD03722]MDV5862560.1 ATP-binding protein [Pseudomonas mendocina]WGG00768.1 ATP-binding protein [Pseudomonas sp. GD03721]WGG04936.1 ATP-binding protein [Pseudomonas sp. GD03919]